MKSPNIKLTALITVILFASCFVIDAYSQLSLSQIFSNGMVLQRDHAIPVWGKATANSMVSIKILGDSVASTADGSGNWIVEIPVMSAGGPYTMTVLSGAQTISITNVYVGDVWLASGQSNMELQVSNADSASAVIAAANDQKIRQFKIPKGLADEPSDDLPSGSAWTPATSQYAGNFTAVGYFFAKNLRMDIDVPIGIINSSYGGSRLETWMSGQMLGYDEQDTVLASGEPERQPTVAYNKMIYPILRYPIKGIIWYQGESNADNMEDALSYGDLFKTMITSWRGVFNQGDFPFIWVQLPNYGQVYDQPQNWDAWPQLRAGQSSALSLPNTGEAITIDVGDVDIHPKHKQPVGYRISLLARKIAYGENIVSSGPRYYSNLLRDDGKIEINFTDIDSSLVAKDSANGSVKGFAVGDVNNQLAWANAVIEGNKVIVWSDQIPEPSIVRYAWEYNPANVNLYNEEGLPTAPFLANVNPGFKIAKFSAARTVIEQGQSTTLTWLVFGASSVTLDGVDVDTSGTKSVSPSSDTSYILIAVNRENAGEKDTAKVTITVLDPSQINRATNHPVTASTYEACCGTDRLPKFAVDGEMNTRWSSAWQTGDNGNTPDPNLDDNPNDEWIAVDLGEAIDIDRIILSWESAYASQYDIDLSYDGHLWRTVHEERTGNGGEDNITFAPSQSGRFVRLHCINRATQFGYSLFEIGVYGLIAVKKPPTIKVNTNQGNVVSPNTELTLTAATTVDTSSTVQQVDFYSDGELLGTITSEPFQIQWTPGENEKYSIIAVVTDHEGLEVQSDTLTVYTENATFTRFEAEKASYTGQGNKITSAGRSGGAYMEMRDAWTLTFNNISMPEEGDYLFEIAYLLNFESPKTQYLVVNGDTVEEIEFTAPNTTAWLNRGTIIHLNSELNTVAFYGYWNWMSFDFIAIPGATIVGVSNTESLPKEFTLSQNYPNPFNPTTMINYNIPKRTHVVIKVYDTLGREIATLVNKKQNAGSYQINFSVKGGSSSGGNALSLASGVYFYSIKAGDFFANKKMILLK